MAAQKKSTASRSGSAGKKTTAARGKQTTAKTKETATGISPTELIGLALVGLAAVSLAVLITGDVATNAFKALLTGLAGVLSWAVPVLLLWAGLLIGFAGKKKYDVSRILLMVLCVLLAFGVVHIFSAQRILLSMQLKTGFLNFVQQSFFDRGGAGALGALLSYPAYRALGGKWGGFIALLFLLAGTVVWLKQISLRRLSEKAVERFETTRTEYIQRHEERVQQRQQARAQQPVQQLDEDFANWEPITATPGQAKAAPAAVQTEPGAQQQPILKSAQPLQVPDYVKSSRRKSGKILGGKAITPEETQPAAGEEAEEDEPGVDTIRPFFFGKSRKQKKQAQQQEEESIEVIPPIVAPSFTPATPAVLAVQPAEDEEEPVDIPGAAPQQNVAPAPRTLAPADAKAAPANAKTAPATLAPTDVKVAPAAANAVPAPATLAPTAAAAADDEDEEEPVDIPAAGADNPFAGFGDEDDDGTMLFGNRPAPQEEEDEDPDFDPLAETGAGAAPVQSQSAPAAESGLTQPTHRTPHRQELGRPVNDILPPDSYASDVQPLAIEPERRLDGTPIEKNKHETYGMDEPFKEYNYPPVDLLAPPKPSRAGSSDDADQQKAQTLIETLHYFGISVELTGVAHGPAVTRFEVFPAPGTKVSRITALADDLALNLRAPSIRIEAPIPGKAAVGIEIPNDKVETVSLREVLESADARNNASRLAFGVGKDNGGRCIVGDIAKMPHVLIAGATGSGKSVCINCIICSILYRATPDEVRLIMVDPKMVELSVYNGIPHLLTPVVTDPKKAAGALNWAVAEMLTRYHRFADRNVRNIKGFNAALEPGEKPMPQIVIIIDELADLMMACPGEVEDSIQRLAQLARAAGIHMVIATQRPSVNVITGTIKANIPARIAFTTSSYVDSRTILDVGGAEKLLGRGDMLFAPNGSNRMQRVQGAWVSDEEVTAIVEYIKNRHEADYDEDVIEHMNREMESEGSEESGGQEESGEKDELLEEAIRLAVEAGQMSISMLQRRMRIGYARAGRLIDEMAARGVVSQSEGSKPRQVLITREQYQQMFGGDAGTGV